MKVKARWLRRLCRWIAGRHLLKSAWHMDRAALWLKRME